MIALLSAGDHAEKEFFDNIFAESLLRFFCRCPGRSMRILADEGQGSKSI